MSYSQEENKWKVEEIFPHLTPSYKDVPFFQVKKEMRKKNWRKEKRKKSFHRLWLDASENVLFMWSSFYPHAAPIHKKKLFYARHSMMWRAPLKFFFCDDAIHEHAQLGLCIGKWLWTRICGAKRILEKAPKNIQLKKSF